MFNDLQKWVNAHKAVFAVVLVLALIIVGWMLKNHFSGPRMIKNMPHGSHQCINKNTGSVVFSKQPCSPEEMTIKNPDDVNSAQGK